MLVSFVRSFTRSFVCLFVRVICHEMNVAPEREHIQCRSLPQELGRHHPFRRIIPKIKRTSLIILVLLTMIRMLLSLLLFFFFFFLFCIRRKRKHANSYFCFVIINADSFIFV